MTESEWLACTDLEPMFLSRFLWDPNAGRKLRLFGVGCCRQIWRLIEHEDSRRAVVVAEGHADGEDDLVWLEFARQGANQVAEMLAFEAQVKMSLRIYARRDAALAAELVTGPAEDMRRVAAKAREAIASTPYPAPDQCSLLRCLFGPLPFRDVALDPAWLSWNEGAVATLAGSIYQDRAFDRLPFLGDALEEAGCADPDILDHCRQRSEHARGCWIVDLILGKS
jgi:hypothetical protein